jgi:hypothetical protein
MVSIIARAGRRCQRPRTDGGRGASAPNLENHPAEAVAIVTNP